MIKENQAEFEKSNVLTWHNAGYKGQGATVLVLDDKGLPFSFTNVETPFLEEHRDTNHNTHICCTVREVAPVVRIISIPWTFTNISHRKKATDWIVQHKDEIDIINCSWGGTTGEEEFNRLKDLDIPVICATGNDYKEDKINRPARYDWTIAVVAVTESNGHVTAASNKGKEVDVGVYTNIYIPKADGTNTWMFTDTSCAAAVCSGMLAIYLSWRKEKGLPRLGREDIRKFVYDNAIDMYEQGHDYRSGYGLFILPNKIPQTEIPIEKKEEETMTKFKDTEGHWAEGPIDYVAEKGLLKGYEDGTFKPNATVTRAELATVLARQNGYVEKK